MTTATHPTTSERIAPWPGLAEICPKWCAGRHDAADSPEDRNHFSATVDVPVQAYKPELIDGVLTLGWLTVCLRQHVEAKHPTVELLDENRDTYQLGLTAGDVSTRNRVNPRKSSTPGPLSRGCLLRA